MKSFAEKKSISWLLYTLGLGMIIFIMSCVSAFFSRQPLWEPCAFSAYQIIAVLIPGMAYVKLLRQDENRGGVACLVIGYALGYGSNIVWYYVLSWLGGMESSRTSYFICLTLQCAVSILYLCRKKVQFSEKNSNWIIAMGFTGIFFVIELFAYGGFNMLPPYTDGSNIWKDVLYWIGNTVSLKIGFPPVEFRDLRPGYSYHYFSSIQLAAESITTGIPVAELSIYFSYIQALVLVIGGIYCITERRIQKKTVLSLFFFLCLFTSGYEGMTRVNYVSHLYLSQYGFDYGLGFMLLLLDAISDFWEKDFSYCNYLYLTFLFAILMGTKSTFACIGIVGIGVLCICFLIKRNWKKAFIQGITILTAFFFIYFNVCSIEGYGGSIYNVIPILGLGRSAEAEESIETDSEEMNKAAELTFQEEVNEHNMDEGSAVTEEAALAEEVEIIEPVESDTDQTIVYYWDEAENLENYRELIFRNKAVPKFILEFFFWLFFAALCHPCLWILVCCGGIYKVFAKRKFNALDISCLIMVITGISIALYIYMGGKSNIYFALATYPVAWFFLAYVIPETREMPKLGKYGAMVITILVILYGSKLFLYHSGYNPIVDFWRAGKNNYRYSNFEILDSEYGLTGTEYEALKYVYEEIDSDETLISINKRENDRNLAGIFSEHKVLNMNLQAVSDDENILYEKINEMGIRYLIVPVENADIVNSAEKVLFENEEWKVVKWE